jgi:hypothetical protein
MLQNWAQQNVGRIQELEEKDRPMSVGTVGLMVTINVDFVLSLLLSGSPLKVQQVFGKDSWTLADFMTLRPVEYSNNR